jgi:hypothetical protein
MIMGGNFFSLISGIIAAVLVLTGLDKIFPAQDGPAFTLIDVVFRNHRQPAGRALGTVELSIGIAMLTALTEVHLLALWAALILFVTASTLVYLGLRMDVKPSCGCSSGHTGVVTRIALLRTILFAAFCAACLSFNGLSPSNTVATRLVGCTVGIASVIVTPSWRPGFLTFRLSRSQRLVHRLRTKGCSASKLPFIARLTVSRALRDDAVRQICANLPKPIRITDKWTDGCWHYVSLEGANAQNGTLVIAQHAFSKSTLRHQLLNNDAQKSRTIST